MGGLGVVVDEDECLVYCYLIGKDNCEFCECVSVVLEDGYVFYGYLVFVFNGEYMVVG